MWETPITKVASLWAIFCFMFLQRRLEQSCDLVRKLYMNTLYQNCCRITVHNVIRKFCAESIFSLVISSNESHFISTIHPRVTWTIHALAILYQRFWCYISAHTQMCLELIVSAVFACKRNLHNLEALVQWSSSISFTLEWHIYGRLNLEWDVGTMHTYTML